MGPLRNYLMGDCTTVRLLLGKMVDRWFYHLHYYDFLRFLKVNCPTTLIKKSFSKVLFPKSFPFKRGPEGSLGYLLQFIIIPYFIFKEKRSLRC